MEIKWVIAHFFGRPIMQNEPSKRKRARFAVLEALLLIAAYCALALIGSFADSDQISSHPGHILAQKIAIFVWIAIAAPLVVFEMCRQQREDPAHSLSREETRAKIVKLAITMAAVFCVICVLALALLELGLFFGSVGDVRDFAFRALIALLAIFAIDVPDVRRSIL